MPRRKKEENLTTENVTNNEHINECLNVLCGNKDTIDTEPTPAPEKKKRGRPKKKVEEVVEAIVETITETPKKRGRKKKVEEVEAIIDTIAEAPKKRGKKKEAEDAVEAIIDTIAEAPKKRGKKKKVEEVVEEVADNGISTVIESTIDDIVDEYFSDDINFDDEDYDVDPDDDQPFTTPEELNLSNYCLFSNTITPINKRDVRKAIHSDLLYIPKAGSTELKKLVDTYYRLQKFRIMSDSQVRAIGKNEPESDRKYLEDIAMLFRKLEDQVKLFLDCVTDEIPVCNTIKHVCGIGPVISAGLYAHFDITRAKTAGAYWRYCGIDPTLPPKVKGEKLKYNKELKTLVVFKLGDSFIKVKNNKKDLYGHYYDEYREYYEGINERGGYADRCKKILEEKDFKKDTKAKKSYLEGKLPDGHIHSMSRRKPVTIFVSHLFDLQYMIEYGKKSPRPYIIAHSEGHVHEIENPLIAIFEELYGCHPTKYNR